MLALHFICSPIMKDIYKPFSYSNHKPLPILKHLIVRFYKRDSDEERLRGGKIYLAILDFFSKIYIITNEGYLCLRKLYPKK